MAIPAQTRTDETVHTLFQLGAVPKKRESEFTTPQQGSKVTKMGVATRLLDGISGIESKCGFKMSGNDKNDLAQSLAREIMSLGGDDAINRKTSELLKAMSEIALAEGKKTKGQALALSAILRTFSGSSENIPNFFKHPDEFVQIARIAREGAYWAFSALGGKFNALNFDKHPKEMVQIARVGEGKEGVGAPDKMILFFDEEKPAKMLDTFPTECVQLVQACGTGILIEILGNEKTTALFFEHSASFVEMGRTAGRNARSYVHALQNDRLNSFFAKDPGKTIVAFEEISKYFQRDQSKVSMAFYKLSKDEKVTADFLSWQNGGMPKEKFFENLEEAMKKF